MDRNEELLRLEQELAELESALKSSVSSDSDRSPPRNHVYSSKQDELRSLNSELAELEDFLSNEGGLPPKPGVGFMGRTGQVARGMARTYGGIADLAQKAILTGGLHEDIPRLPSFSDEKPTESGKKSIFQQRDELNEEIARQMQGGAADLNLSEKLPSYIDRAYGQNLEPTDTTGKFLQGFGEFAAPIPLPGGGAFVKAGKSGTKALAKELGKEAATASGISAALNVAPRISDEGTLPGFVEDFGKTILGAKAGKGLPGSVVPFWKTIASPIKNSKNALENLYSSSRDELSRLSSKLIKPNKDILQKASRYDIELPFNVGANSTPANFLANNYLKSTFVSAQYKDALKRSSDSLINSVKKSIDTLGDQNIGSTESSVEFAQYLKGEEKKFKKDSDALYESARKALKKEDKIVPSNTLRSLNSEAIQDLLGNLSPSRGERRVVKRIEEISNKLGPSKAQKETLEAYKDKPRYLDTIKKQFEAKKGIPVNELINLRKSLMNTLNYEPDVRGSEAFLANLVKTLDSDIKNIKNKDFLDKYQDANRFFKNNIGQRFRKSVAVSLMKNEAPREAYSLMNSVSNVKRLEKTIGENPKGKEIFDSLKKAKIREIFGSAIEGDLRTEGSIRTAAFAKLFQKGEPQQDLIRKLLGGSEYKKLQDISEIANEFSKSGRELINTSGTAHVLSDLNLAKDVSNQVMKTFAYLGGGVAAGYSVAGPLGAAAAISTPWFVSRLVSDPKFVKNMREYTISRKQGREKHADIILRRKLVPFAVHEYTELKKSKEEE